MADEDELIVLKLRAETAVWLRSLLERMQVNGSAKEVRKLLAYSDEVLAQLPDPEEKTAI